LRPPAGVPTPAATNPQPRFTHPSSAAARATPITSPVARPRRPRLSSTQTHATIEHVTPASATASPPTF
jgi:hypothetical protein